MMPEITKAMIEAGAERHSELCTEASQDYLLTQIFEAMWNARTKKEPPEGGS